MNYYPFHIGDFRSGTINMSRQTRWIYRDMMDVYYDAEAPLPLDIDTLCNELGVEETGERAIVERLLRFKFIKTDDGYRHAICDKVIAEYRVKAETAKANGKLGGRPRKQSAPDAKPSGFPSGSNTDATGNPIETGSKTNQEPITNNHKPVNLKPSSASPPEPYPEEFETVWLAYPPRPGASKKDSYKGWTARRKEGVSTEALLAGVQRYANYVLLSRTEPQFTKQPATFFGPGEHYKADWAVGATQTQKGVIHGNFGKQDYHKGVGADGTF